MVRIKVFKIFDGGSNPPSPAVSELLPKEEALPAGRILTVWFR